MSFKPHSQAPVGATLQWLVSRMRTAALPRLRTLAFWLAIGLPWTLLAFVFAGYTSQHPVLLAVLLAGNVLCGLAGQGYPHR